MRKSIVVLSENEIFFQRKMTYHSVLLELLDTLYSSFVVCPLVIAYWRGTWNLSDLYLYPNNKIQSSFASLLLGIVGHLVFTIWQGSFEKFLNPDRHRLIFYIASRLYTAIYGIICVNCWRGGWQLVDHYTARDMKTILSVTILAIVALMALKSLRNVIATPFVVVTDQTIDYFKVPTKYKTLGTRETGLFIMDCLFSVLIIGSLVVFVWRGVWVLMDLKLYPNLPEESAWASMIIGYIIVGLTFSMQPIVRWSCERLKGFSRIIFADIFLFTSFVGTVSVWRGIWQCLDHYFLPNNRELSDWITHGCSFILLVLLNCGQTVLVRGVFIDGEEKGGECVVFPTHFIRLFFAKERKRKLKRDKIADLNLENINHEDSEKCQGNCQKKVNFENNEDLNNEN